mmetsp:Transcript_5141/g.8109  ORF Transcript_5141/g.8109 Transcript_5141/m.8109 type:complete len:87 (-) Transcript_5141:109-369(-)
MTASSFYLPLERVKRALTLIQEGYFGVAAFKLLSGSRNHSSSSLVASKRDKQLTLNAAAVAAAIVCRHKPFDELRRFSCETLPVCL